MLRHFFPVRLMPSLILLLVAVTALAGCGQKGELVRPEAPKAAQAAA